MIENIFIDKQLIAIIVPSDFTKRGVEFFTPNEFSQQLAYMSHPAGKKIVPHRHNAVPREVHFTQEALFIRKGKVRVDFYNDNEIYQESRICWVGR